MRITQSQLKDFISEELNKLPEMRIPRKQSHIRYATKRLKLKPEEYILAPWVRPGKKGSALFYSMSPKGGVRTYDSEKEAAAWAGPNATGRIWDPTNEIPPEMKKLELGGAEETKDDKEATPLSGDIASRFKQVTGIDYPLKKAAEALQKMSPSQFKHMVLEEIDNMLSEGNKAAKTVGDPPYRERGSTESQAQQKAAGMALSARRGDTPVSKLKGAAKELYSGEISTKDLRNLAKLGQKVKQHKSKEPKHLKSLPGHATPAKD